MNWETKKMTDLDASLRSVNCVRFATRCRRPRSNHWWSLWCYRLDYGKSMLIGLAIHLVRCLQSVQNAAAWLICRLRRFDHVTDALVNLHLLRVVYKIAVLTFKVLHGIAPEYLGPVVRVANLPGRQSVRSAGTNRLVVPPFKLSTIGTRAFAVAGPHIWNSLPADITSAPSLSTFRQ